jgi:hypothetical protein
VIINFISAISRGRFSVCFSSDSLLVLGGSECSVLGFTLIIIFTMLFLLWQAKGRHPPMYFVVVVFIAVRGGSLQQLDRPTQCFSSLSLAALWAW